jgi:hypothetical protein
MAVSNLMTVETVRMTCPPSSKTGQTTGEDPACVPGPAGRYRPLTDIPVTLPHDNPGVFGRSINHKLGSHLYAAIVTQPA